jgi:hypothetical protein
MKELLKKDLENYNEEKALDAKNNPGWTEMEQAIAVLDKNPSLFIQTYFINKK